MMSQFLPPEGPKGDEGRVPSDACASTPTEQYLGESPERVRELSAALGTLRAGDPDALLELQRCFQELVVSAGSHGLAEVASRCAAARQAVATLAHGPLPLSRADLATLERHVLGVAEAFRLAQPRPQDTQAR